MKNRLLAFAVFTVLLLPAFAAAKDVWTNVNSKNFHLIGNASEKDIRRVATKLEQFREAFTQLFPKANFDSGIPTTVVVFKNASSYKPFLPVREDGKADTKVEGYFQPGDDVNYITLSIESELAETYSTIFHEYVHFLLNTNFGRSTIPPWFNEGLASYYQTFRMEGDQKAILGDLENDYLFLLQQQQMIPLETFFAIDNYSLHRQANHGRSIFYAQSWALLHYLQQGNKGARRSQLTKFLGLLLNNKQPREAFGEAFQTDYATMEKELRKYVEQRSFVGNSFTFKEKLALDATMTSASLSEAEAGAYLGDLLLHTNRLDEAAVRLQQTLALDQTLPMTHTSLGILKMRQRKFSEARTHLEKSVALNAENYLAHYYYAYTLSREGMDESSRVSNYPPEPTEKMRKSLRRAMELNPNFPESYHLLAFINLVNDNFDEGLAAINKAISLEPGNQSFSFILAQLYLHQENYDEARKIAEKIAATAEEPDLRGQAQSLVNAIGSRQERMASIRAMNEQRAEKSGESGQTIVVEQSPSMSPAEAMNQAINNALRKPQTGEQRVIGYLTEIACDSKGQLFIVRAENNQILKLRLAGGKDLMLTAFTSEMSAQQIACGARKPENFVVATYRPTTDAKAKFNGEVVALEFVSKDFKLK